MDLPFELFVALRYLLARRKQAFISLISFVSTLGVAVGVMALIVALALMTGLQTELRDRIVGSSAHIYVWRLGRDGIADPAAEVARLGRFPRVEGAAPAMLGKALVEANGQQAFITLKGVDPALEARVTEIERAMAQGSLAALARPAGEELDAILGVPGLSGVTGGPNDLAASLGYPGQPGHPEVAASGRRSCTEAQTFRLGRSTLTATAALYGLFYSCMAMRCQASKRSFMARKRRHRIWHMRVRN